MIIGGGGYGPLPLIIPSWENNMAKSPIDLGNSMLRKATRAKENAQAKRRPGEAPSTIAGRTARTAPVKKSAKGTSAAEKKRLPRQATSGGGSGLAGRSPAMSPKKKGDAGRRAADRAAERAKSDARRTRSADMDRARRSESSDKAAQKKRSDKRRAMATEKKRDRAASRNRRYKDDRAYRD